MGRDGGRGEMDGLVWGGKGWRGNGDAGIGGMQGWDSGGLGLGSGVRRRLGWGVLRGGGGAMGRRCVSGRRGAAWLPYVQLGVGRQGGKAV